MAKKKKKKRVIKLKNIIIILCILSGIIGLFYYALTMPIKNIYIINNEFISDYEIINQANLEDYPSFLLTKKSTIITTLEKNEYIDQVTVKKKLGNILELTIQEYQPIALTTENKIILSNALEIENTYNLNDLPLLINKIDNSQIAQNFAKKFSKVDKNILRQISQIEYSPVAVDEERFILYMNDTNLVHITLTKINKLNKYNQIKDKLNGQTGIIYLDSGNYIELKQPATSLQ